MLSGEIKSYYNMKYNKDYTTKTAKEWLDQRKWTAFLMRVPVGKAQPFVVKDANDINSIRSTASALNKDAECDRTFEIGYNFANSIIAVTVTRKEHGRDS